MYETIWVLLFLAGILLAIGAFGGYSRGFSALVGTLWWAHLGNTVSSVFVLDPSDGDIVRVGMESQSVEWLMYIVAVLHIFAFFIAIYEAYTQDAGEHLPGPEVNNNNQ